jgi:hypothetical protein
VVELARLESEYTPKGYRGFESPSLRQKQKIIPPFWRVFCFLTMAVMPWYEQTAEENNIILGNAQDDFLLLKHHCRGSRAKRVIPLSPQQLYEPRQRGCCFTEVALKARFHPSLRQTKNVLPSSGIFILLVTRQSCLKPAPRDHERSE